MPTGNEYSVVMYGQQEQSYKENSQQQRSGDFDPQVGGGLPSPPPGNYPLVYDRQAGQEVSGPDNYPQGVYDHIPATGQAQDYVNTERESVSGDYGQSDGITSGLYPGNNMVPDNVPSKQFSSDKEGDPKKLVRQAVDSINAHADLVMAYGYRQPVATLGSHPWLRDELANSTELEPANAEPKTNLKTPFRGGS